MPLRPISEANASMGGRDRVVLEARGEGRVNWSAGILHLKRAASLGQRFCQDWTSPLTTLKARLAALGASIAQSANSCLRLVWEVYIIEGKVKSY